MAESIFILLFIAAASLCGYYFKLLTKSGSIAAFFVGILVGKGFGAAGLLLLGFFFASSSFWSKYKSKQKQKIAERHEKGSRRDWLQVTANGGTAALFSMLYIIFPEPIWLLGFSISIAAANSDTWASEIGSLSKSPPIFIRSFKRIETGTSGAISLLGTAAALCGALTIAILSGIFFKLSIMAILLIFIFGFIGNIIDTLMGAFVQVVYKCRICGAEVEALRHCGENTVVTRGFPLINNDFVNFSSGFLAAILGILIM